MGCPIQFQVNPKTPMTPKTPKDQPIDMDPKITWAPARNNGKDNIVRVLFSDIPNEK